MNSKYIKIKQTKPSDFNAIMEVEELAFGQVDEARLTADLLSDKTAEPILSLLAFHDEKAVGHILFTRAYVNNLLEQPLFHILAPLAVIPDYQRQGIGGLLIIEGLKRLRAMGSEMVLVLGHMEYYPKYGFIPDAGKLGYEAPYPIPEEFANAWMIQSLKEIGFTVKTGKIHCAEAMNKPEY